MIGAGRFSAVLQANHAVVSELSLVVVLHRIVEAARDVSEARYAALGVLGASIADESPIRVDDVTP